MSRVELAQLALALVAAGYTTAGGINRAGKRVMESGITVALVGTPGTHDAESRKIY